MTKITDKLYLSMLERIENGETISKVCDKACISRSAFYKYAEKSIENKQAFERAKRMGYEALLDTALDLSMSSWKGKEIITSDKGVTVKESDNVSRATLAVNTIHKTLALKDPARYGKKLDVTTGGETLNNMSDEALLLIALGDSDE